MFDKLIESDTAGADFKNRSRYFTVSTIIVGILFLTAVVYSLYAAEVGLGKVNFDIAELVSPLVEAESEIPKQLERSNQQRSDRSELPVRTDNIARLDEPQFVPNRPSSEASRIPSRPVGRFILDPGGTISNGSGGPTGSPNGRPDGSSSASTFNDVDEIETKDTEPPPPITKKPPTIVRTSKILNGSAISLPKPAYPKPAQMLNLEGSVNVQVTIDENGNVVSAKAADGHPFFRVVAEQAARGAKFRPTILNDNPIKVTGIIVYRFKRS